MNNKNLLKHVWSVACSNAVIDSQSNNISLFNTLEKLTINVKESDLERVKKEGTEGIVFPISFEVVSRFTRGDTGVAQAFDYRLSLLNPTGKPVVNSEQKIAIEKHIKNMRVRTNIQVLPVSIAGDYILVVEFKDVAESRFDKVAELPLEIVINSIPTKNKV